MAKAKRVERAVIKADLEALASDLDAIAEEINGHVDDGRCEAKDLKAVLGLKRSGGRIIAAASDVSTAVERLVAKAEGASVGTSAVDD